VVSAEEEEEEEEEEEKPQTLRLSSRCVREVCVREVCVCVCVSLSLSLCQGHALSPPEKGWGGREGKEEEEDEV